jgi:geranylgeranyl diphosphate synthase, type I
MAEALTDQLKSAGALIAPQLREHLRSYGQELNGINSWGDDVCDRVAEYSVRGKLIRGSLVITGNRAFGGNDSKDVVDAACAMELVQSFLLIHDDIMDGDDTRRGAPSVHAQYRDGAAGWAVSEGVPFGRSMGICAGDVTLLLAQRLLAGLAIDGPVYRRINQLVAREIAFVGVAQMNDLYFGYLSHAASEEEVYDLYRYKTGRYTFSLPLALGAVFAGASPEAVEAVMRFGEEVGIIFQVIDDDIGIFGETESTGKPVGSDIASNKKTLHRRYFLEALASADSIVPADRERLSAYFGASNLSRAAIEELRSAFADLGVRDRISELVERHAARAREIADELADRHVHASVRPSIADFLSKVVEFNLARRR